MKTSQDIEQKLTALAPDSVGFDREGVRMKLLKSITKTPVPSPYWSHFRVLSTSMAMFFFLFIGTSYASLSSLPGEPLYAMKVNVTEELIALTKISPDAALDYAITRLETRQSELATLQAESVELDSTVVADLAEELIDEVETIAAIVTDETSTEVETSRLPKLAKVKSLVADNSSLTTVLATSSALEDRKVAEAAAASLFENEVAEYVAVVGTTTAVAILSEQLDEIQEKLLASSTPADIQTDSEVKLQEMREYLDEDKYTEALIETLELAEDLDVIE